jgi:hypothetical protein
MVEIHLYGKLRRYLNESLNNEGGVLNVSVQPQETVADLLARIGVPLEGIYNIFLNSRLLASRSKMAYCVRYPQVHKDPLDWKLDIPVKAGDRIGLFGKDMAALVI